jgi:hypothetical protein
MQEDYPELCGKEIIMRSLQSGNDYPAKVVDANFYVGITIVDRHNTDRKFACLNFKECSEDLEKYRRTFKIMIAAIRTGVYVFGTANAAFFGEEKERKFGPLFACPFGQ